MTPEQEANVLSVDQFGDDFSGPGDKLLSDHFVTGRKQYTCCWCDGSVPTGSRHRVSKSVMDGEIHTIRYCPKCCDAMLKDFDEDDCEHLEARVSINREGHHNYKGPDA